MYKAVRVLAGFRTTVRDPAKTRTDLFDTDACRKFGGARYTLVSAREFPALVRCLTALAPRLYPDPDAGAILYGAGSRASVAVQEQDGVPRMRAFMGADPRQIEGDAAPIDGAVLAPLTARYFVPVPPKLRASLDASPTRVAKAHLRICVDLKGNVDAVTILDVGPDVPEFGAMSEKAVRRWKLQPFLVRGKPVRACGTVVTAYPASRVGPGDRVIPNAYPPPPPAE